MQQATVWTGSNVNEITRGLRKFDLNDITVNATWLYLFATSLSAHEIKLEII